MSLSNFLAALCILDRWYKQQLLFVQRQGAHVLKWLVYILIATELYFKIIKCFKINRNSWKEQLSFQQYSYKPQENIAGTYSWYFVFETFCATIWVGLQGLFQMLYSCKMWAQCHTGKHSILENILTHIH